MSEQTISLAESVHGTISDYLAGEESPGMVTGFVLIVSSIDSDGNAIVRVASPHDQGLHLSLGLAGFATEWVKDDIRAAFYPNPNTDD